jgi:hypothetical protein
MTTSEAYQKGLQHGYQAFGIRVAFLPALGGIVGSVVGGTAARAGVGALARKGIGGRLVGGLANSRMGQMGIDMAGSHIGGGLLSRMTGGSRVQQPPPMV